MKILFALLLLLGLCGCCKPPEIDCGTVQIHGGTMEKVDGKWVIRDSLVVLEEK